MDVKKLKFAIVVHAAPYSSEGCLSALKFTQAAIAAGHEVLRVFFYHDGVNNATRLTTPPSDERHVVGRWAALARERKLDLVVCVAAAQRRGVVDADEMKRHGKDAHNIAPEFRISGLGQLIEAGIEADRLIVFGD